MRRALAAVVAVLGVGVAVAGATAGGEPSSPRALEVELDEWGLAASRASVAAGRTTLLQKNSGRVEHELLIVRTALPADELPMGLEGVKPSLAGQIVFGAEHSHHERGRTRGGDPAAAHLAPGETRRASARLRRGRYVLLCGIEGHYEAGQHAVLSVE